MKYDFLILALLCGVPGLVILLIRRDLRPLASFMALASLPFALTESLFYPAYWEPRFLFNLADIIGFGIEDLIFVAGLGVLSSTIYPFCSGKHLTDTPAFSLQNALFRRIHVLLASAVLVGLAILFSIPMIYASVFIMLLVSAVLLLIRRDLALPALLGGLLTCAVYTLICILFAQFFTDVFHLVWHGERFSNVFIMGVLLEEYLYSFAAGFAGTIIYPFVTGRLFVSKKQAKSS